MAFPVIRAAAQVLAHVPGLAIYGSKPRREITRHGPEVEVRIRRNLRAYPEALAYAPNQVFIGGLDPDQLNAWPQPWSRHPLSTATRQAAFGEIMPEEEFLGLLKLVDVFNLVELETNFQRRVGAALEKHPLVTPADLIRLDTGGGGAEIAAAVAAGGGIPLTLRSGEVVGLMRHGHPEDDCLQAPLLLENLSAKASAVLAVRQLLHMPAAPPAGEIDYILNTGEEAVGDRYQRGAGNLAKAVGESCACVNASGADVSAFCNAPLHALLMAGALVQAGVFRNVLVIGGGALAKLAMKFVAHLDRELPILEDMLAAFAVLVSPDDGVSPIVRLDSIGKHDIGCGSSAQAVYERLVLMPLRRRGLRLTDVDRYAVEMHNPEIMAASASGNVTRTNYRMIASLAVMQGEIDPTEIDDFVAARGMPGFSPTQGHIAAAVPYLGHALGALTTGRAGTVMLVAKGSLFLGMMTRMADGVSILLERNPGRRPPTTA